MMLIIRFRNVPKRVADSDEKEAPKCVGEGTLAKAHATMAGLQAEANGGSRWPIDYVLMLGYDPDGDLPSPIGNLPQRG